ALWLIDAMFAVSGMAGLGGPAGQLLTQVPLAKWFVARRGRALAIATTGMAMGTVAAVPLTQWLVESIGWRGTTVVYGCLVAGVVVPVSLLLVRRAPEDLGLHPDGAAGPPARSVLEQPTRRALLTTDADWTVREALRTPALWLLLGALALAGASLTGTLVYRVGFWRDTGMSPGLVGLGTALDPLTVVFSAFAFGLVADRVPIRYLGCAGLVGLAASMLPMVLSAGQPSTIILHNVTWGMAAGGYITLNNLVWPNYFGRRFLGAIRGVVLPVSIAAAGIGTPLYGYLLDAGLEPTRLWMISAAAFLLAAGLVFAARPPRAALPARATALAEPGAVS
ncbi:MAG: MFS transporter, partial [Dehalococcoidia bacterium]|nr:MFS transporter [Dehalococcoidia bacterium]